MNADDRRREPRIDHKRLAHVAQDSVGAEYNEEIMGNTADLSMGGVRFEGHDGFKEGSHVRVSFAIDDNVVEANGQVVHFTPKEDGTVTMGIKFLGLSEVNRKLLLDYCQTRSDQGGN